METKTLRKTALNGLHCHMGAKMVDFGGWHMPVEYPATGGLMKEHLAVRTGVGMFDVSHMGDILIRGPQALDAVQWVSMNDASRLQEGQAHYSALLYPEGTFVDDVIVHKLGQNDYYVVLYQLSLIPEAKIQPVFEDYQWRFLKRQIEQGRRMEKSLKQQGFVPGDESDAKGKTQRPVEAKAALRPN